MTIEPEQEGTYDKEEETTKHYYVNIISVSNGDTFFSVYGRRWRQQEGLGKKPYTDALAEATAAFATAMANEIADRDHRIRELEAAINKQKTDHEEEINAIRFELEEKAMVSKWSYKKETSYINE